MISNDDSHELKIILTGRDSFNFEEFFVSKSNFSLNSQSMDEGKTALIPSWIKNMQYDGRMELLVMTNLFNQFNF